MKPSELESFQRNPFIGAANPGDTAREIDEHAKGGLVVAALERGDVGQAERLVLAIGHAEIIALREEPLALAERIWRGLPRDREDYLRVVEAAGRCAAALGGLVGESSAMREVRRSTWAACFGDSLHHAMQLEQVIVDHDVLVLGETGTGKEAVATAIQSAMVASSAGAIPPRSALNAAAVPETLIESELFGHVKGAFTGASETRLGRIRSATGGSFFLDEVGDLPETTQVKLLRVMETNEVSPLGADQGVAANVRYVAATHKNLEAMVEEDRFRRDLYQRLAGHVIRIPPLRERRQDIPELGRAFVARYVPEGLAEVWAGVERWLEEAARWDHSWTGNVRELQNALRSVMLGMPPDIRRGQPLIVDAATIPQAFLESRATMQEVTDWYLARVLDETEDNFAAASRVLGMDRATIRRRAARLVRK